MSKRVIIVGGVAGGASCAARLRRLDEQAKIFMYERGADVSFANCGLPYYLGGVITNRQKLLLATPERFRDWFNVEVRIHHEVLKIDREARTVDVRNTQTGETTTQSYDTLVLAPGAAPIRPSLPGVDLPGVFTIRNLTDIDQVQNWIAQREAERAVVIGGGYIGLEMTENLIHRGLDVTLFEMLDQVMPPMDPEMVVAAHEVLRARGVDLQLSNSVTAISEGPEETLKVIDRASQSHFADLVIMAVGVRPDVGLARDAGLQIGHTGGIRVDDQMRTSDPAIFAVGDAVEVRDFVTAQPALIPLAGPANRQGRIAADVIAGRSSSFRGTQGTAVLGLFDLTLAMTGATEKTLKRLGTPYEVIHIHGNDHAGYYPGAHMMAIKLLFSPDDGRVLGAQVTGRAGVDKRIDVIAMAIQKGATVFDLEETELCYAPQYGSAKDPVNMAGFVASNILRGDVVPADWDHWYARRDAGEPLPVVLDVRTPEEFAADAVPDAINIPLGELRARLDELPRDGELWVHCGIGQRAYYACRILQQHGYRVRNLAGGLKTFKLKNGM